VSEFTNGSTINVFQSAQYFGGPIKDLLINFHSRLGRRLLF